MTWPPLEQNEVELPDTDPAELYLRAVPARCIDDGVITQDAFELSRAERVPGSERLSGARETKQTAVALLAARSNAVLVCAISVDAIHGCGLLRVVDDSMNVADAVGHTYIDMRRLTAEKSKPDRRMARQNLADRALTAAP